MVKKIRTQRVAERIRQELAEIFTYELTDPRLDGVNVTDVEVDRELAYAKVFVSALEGSSRKDEILDGLSHAAGFLRYTLSQRIDLRSFPQLRFSWDATAERADRIDRLLNSLKEEEKEDKGDSVDE